MKLGAVTGMQLLVTYKRRPGPEQDALKVRMTFGLITAIACPSITPLLTMQLLGLRSCSSCFKW